MSDARQSVEAAANVGAEKHAPIALESAQQLLSKAQDKMQAGQYEEAQKDALAAREAARQALAITQAKLIEPEPALEPEPKTEPDPKPVLEPEPEITREAAPLETVASITYTVKQHDNLWNIAARASVYDNPLLWPLLFKANADSISNPDVILPGQILTVEISPSDADRTAARRFAMHRGSRTSEDASYLRQYGLR